MIDEILEVLEKILNSYAVKMTIKQREK